MAAANATTSDDAFLWNRGSMPPKRARCETKTQVHLSKTDRKMAPSFTGGALSFKGDKKKKKTKHKKKSGDAKHSLHQQGQKDDVIVVVQQETTDTTAATTTTTTTTTPPLSSVEEALMATMTDAERKAYKRKKERERIELEKVARKSHRERVEDFNEKLSQLTELNDLPRVSAAGNG